VNRLLLGIATLATLTLVLPAPAARSSEPAHLRKDRSDLAPIERFRFHAGAALLAPAAAGADGTVCVGTADGYVHLLGPDGSFRWSYSVGSAVIFRPLLSGKLWLIVTNAPRIYALTAQGSLLWAFRPPSEVASELASDMSGTAFFLAADDFLYALSAHGGVSLRAPFGALASGPVTGPDGAIWLRDRAGNTVRVLGQRLSRYPASAPPNFEFRAQNSVRDPAGDEWSTGTDGQLEFKIAGRTSRALVQLTSAALLSPCWSAFGHYALISARDGLVVGLLPRAGQ
jgi:outer membrane protein assembly factor BamB